MDNVRTEYRLGSVLFSPGELNFETPLAANGFTAFCWCLWCLSWSINSGAVNDNVSKKLFQWDAFHLCIPVSTIPVQSILSQWLYKNCVDYPPFSDLSGSPPLSARALLESSKTIIFCPSKKEHTGVFFHI